MKSIECRKMLVLTYHNIQMNLATVSAMLTKLSPEDVHGLFGRNPVFYEGHDKDPNERQETFDTDRYLYLIDQLSKTQQALLQAQERLMRLGVHHLEVDLEEQKHGQEKEKPVRQPPRKEVPRRVEESDDDPIGSTTSVSPY